MARQTKNLTPNGIEAIKAPVGKDREYIPDGGKGSAKGLNLMVTAKGSKSWVWRSRHPVTGKQVKKSLGTFPAVGLADARERAGEHERARLEGYDLDERRAAEAAEKGAVVAAVEAEATKTLRWFWTKLYCPKFIPETKGNETARLIEKHLLPTLGDKPIASITIDDLDDVVAALAKRAPKSADRFVVNLKTIFRRAKRDFRRETKLAANPAEDLVKPDGRITPRERWLTDDELVYFYRAASRLTGVAKVHADCLELILDVGCRLSEARMLTREELDLSAAEPVWTLPPERFQTKGKGGAKNRTAHKMPLASETADRLRARLGTTNGKWVFYSSITQGQPYNSLSKSTAKLLAVMREIAAKDDVTIADWSAHSLRHTFVTILRGCAARREHPMVTRDSIERSVNHVEGGIKGWYNQWEYYEEKKAVYRFWQDRLIKLRQRAAEAETKARAPELLAA